MTLPAAPALAELLDTYAARLTNPLARPEDPDRGEESLIRGAAGIALFHIERAHARTGTWQTAHRWIERATADGAPLLGETGLFQGAPAAAYVLDTAAGSSDRYCNGLASLDAAVDMLAHDRAASVLDRIARGVALPYRELDVFFGLTGLGALMLSRRPGSGATEHILRALVALTRRRRTDDGELPGWWIGHDPHGRSSPEYPGGHANFGVAHGIGGPLALLGTALRRDVEVDGHRDAIDAIWTWYERWQQDADTGPWWPDWISVPNLRAGRPTQQKPGCPSWCYGTPGITRALQTAAIALRDTARQHAAEEALARCLADSAQLAQLREAGLCHGWAGLYQTVWRAAQDAATPVLAAHLPALAAGLAANGGLTGHPGFLTGAAGAALALHTAAHDGPTSGWDACLLLTP
jgi:hypothetical protein